MKNDVIIIGLLTLIGGLFLGYILAPRGAAYSPQDMYTNMYTMHDQMEEIMGFEDHDEEDYEGDALMQHVMDEMMLGFRGKHGEEYEKTFLTSMIAHHEGAIDMAEELLTETQRPELVQMANDIIEVQKAEVEQMETWLNEWFSE